MEAKTPYIYDIRFCLTTSNLEQILRWEREAKTVTSHRLQGETIRGQKRLGT